MKNLSEFSSTIRMFAFLIKDGYSVPRAVEILAQQSTGDIGKMFTKASQLLKSGVSTGDALASAGFPKELCSVASVGEKSGYMAESLELYGTYLEKATTLENVFRSALKYPTVMISLVVVGFVAAILFIVPRIQNMVTSMGADVSQLPVFSKILFVSYGILTPLGNYGAVALVLFLVWFLMFGKGKDLILRLFYFLPQVHSINYRLSWAQWLLLCAVCVKSGMKITQALQTVENMAKPKEISGDNYKKMLKNITTGSMLSVEMKKLNVPPAVVSIIGIAEKSGRVSEAMESLANQYLEQLSFDVRNIGSAIEPVVIVAVAGVGGGLAASIFLTVFSLTQMVGNMG